MLLMPLTAAWTRVEASPTHETMAMTHTPTDARDRTLGRRLRLLAWTGAVSLWLVPLIAMQFTAEVAWTPSDFIVWGVMLSVGAGTFDLATRASGHIAYRLGAGLAVACAFLVVWVNLAVGIIGSEDNPLNLMFFAVLLVAISGAVLSLFRPNGLAVAMVATAVAQGVVGVVAQTQGYFVWPFTVVIAAVWLTAAWLFKKAAASQAAERAGR